MFAALNAYQQGLFQRQHWMKNIISGIIVGIVAIPLAMAFAIASGARPEQGLYTAIIAGIVVALCGGSPVQIAGPTGAFVVILAEITARFGLEGLQMASFMAGIFLILMGMLRVGRLIEFIPSSVIAGFTSGIAVIIFVGEWKDFFGLTSLAPTIYFHQKIISLFHALPHLSFRTTALSCLTLLLMRLLPRWIKRIPPALFAIIAVTLLQKLLHLPGIATIGSAFGGIPSHLPHWQHLDFSWQQIHLLLMPALTIALLGAIESLLSAVVADKMTGTKHRSNSELIGQGFANLLCPLFGGFAATGAIARTATNIRNGGNSPLSGIVHSLTLLLMILLFAPFAAYIPLCTLAAVLFVVCLHMSDYAHFLAILKNGSKIDSTVLITTFCLTIFVNLVWAVFVGVALSTVLRRAFQKILPA